MILPIGLAEAPILGLLALIALSLITLVSLALRSLTKQSDTTSETLTRQVSELNGQLKEALRRSDEAWKDALLARLETERLRHELAEAREDLSQVQVHNQALQAERDAALTKVRELESHNEALRVEVARMEAHLNGLQQRILDLEHRLYKEGAAPTLDDSSPVSRGQSITEIHRGRPDPG